MNKKIKVYIFDNNCRGSVYGVGTYIKELRNVLDVAGINYGLINLRTGDDEVKVSLENGHEIINIPNIKDITFGSYQYYLRNVAYILKEYVTEENDTKLIFHLNYMSEPNLVDALKKLFKQCKIVLTAHYTNWSFSFLGDEEKLGTLLKKSSKSRTKEENDILANFRADVKMIKKVDSLVCVAHHTLATLLKYTKIDPNKAIIISNAVKDEFVPSVDLMSIRKRYKINENEKVVLFVGRLETVKGVEDLINAFKLLLQKYPNTHLFLIGDGDFNNYIKISGDDWSNITFTGKLEKSKVYDFYHIANVGVVCSLHEEFGLVAVEMMMHQIPIVVSDAGGLDEIVDGSMTLSKVPVETKDGKRHIAPQLLAEQIGMMLSDVEIASNIARNGRNRYLKFYDGKLFSSKILTLYKNL